MTLNSRPAHLPDFDTPPLIEVVLGVQFAPPAGYQQILANEVWRLFRDEYPRVEEQPPLPPTFETFGLPSGPPTPQISFLSGATHDRFWFLRPDGEELIQFQQDRLLHNWRKVSTGAHEYPRFEAMFARFQSDLQRLEQYVNSLAPQKLMINQCELSYVNHIEDSGPETGSSDRRPKASEWLRFATFQGIEPDDFSIGFREIFYGDGDRPQGRLICDASTGISALGKQIIQFQLTVRGAPAGVDIPSALQFIASARGKIVTRFAELTTPSAHQNWKLRT